MLSHGQENDFPLSNDVLEDVLVYAQFTSKLKLMLSHAVI